MADAVVIAVIDEKGIKHYAYIPDDPSDPMYHGKPTYCRLDGSFFEEAPPLEELYQLVESFVNSTKDLSTKLRNQRNKKAALFLHMGMVKLAQQIRPVLNYHTDMCRKCVEENNRRIDN